MKLVTILVTLVFVTSCNTTIGLWRDTKAAGSWTKEKIQNRGGGGQDYDYGAPIY